MAKEAPKEIKRQLDKWGHATFLLRCTNAALAITATLSSLVVAATITWFEGPIVAILAFLAAASVALMHTFKTSDKANRIRWAWRNLNAAVILYENDGPITLEGLVQEYSKGEKMIGDVQIELN